MRAILAAVLAALFLSVIPAVALGEDGRPPTEDPDLAALMQATREFRTELVSLREACTQLGRTTPADASGSAKDCKARYAELRQQYQALKEQAMELARRLHEWRGRAKDEADKFKMEAEKEELQRRDQSAVAGKSLPEKLRWLVNHMLQDRIDLELFQQRAREARAQAEQLGGDQREEALRIALQWEQKAADYGEGLKRHEAERQALLAAIARANQPSKDKQERSQPTTGVEKLLAKLRALDQHIQSDRAALERARAEGNEDQIASLEQGLVRQEKQRQELAGQISFAKDKLRDEIRGLDGRITYKRGEQAKHDALAKAYRAAAEQVTGAAREEFLAKALKEDAQSKDWASLAEQYEAQRKRLVSVLELVFR